MKIGQVIRLQNINFSETPNTASFKHKHQILVILNFLSNHGKYLCSGKTGTTIDNVYICIF